MLRIGTKKLYYLLKEEFNNHGIKIGRDALFDYLRREIMLVKPKINYTKTVNFKHWLRKYSNLLKDTKPIRPEQYLVSDIIYIKTTPKTHYLSLVTDVYSRKILRHHLSNDMITENIVKALKMAVKDKIN